MWQLHSLGEAKQNGILLIKLLPLGGRRKKGKKEKDRSSYLSDICKTESIVN